MVQDHAHLATSTTAVPAGPGRSGGARLPRRAAGGVVAVGVLASCLASLGGTAFAATGTPAVAVQVHRSAGAPKVFTAQQDVDAFLAAGYTYADALDLAAIWGSPSVHSAKVRGGSKLLAHWQMPFAPKAAPTTSTTQQDVAAFLASGYDYQDGLELAAIWGSSSVGGAKASAGAKLLAGQDLPEVPKTFTGAQDVAAFSAAGYDHSDAVRLAHLWHSRSVHSAKVHAGARLLARHSLPLQP